MRCGSTNLPNYPFWATCPQILQAGLFIAVFSVFFHTVWSGVLFTSMFHAFMSSVTVSLRVLRGLPLPLKPSISKWVHLFIHLSLFSRRQYNLRQFKLRFDFKGARFKCPYIADRLTLSSAFVFRIQRNIARSLHKTFLEMYIIWLFDFNRSTWIRCRTRSIFEEAFKFQ